MKNIKLKALFLFLIYIVGFTSCYSFDTIKYYSNTNNYVSSTGKVDYINYTNDSIYIGFSELDYKFEDDCFKIIGESFKIVKNNGINEKLKIGSTITITTAPKYMGDGYVMPIVSITINGETLLNFEQGYENLLSWLKNGQKHN